MWAEIIKLCVPFVFGIIIGHYCTREKGTIMPDVPYECGCTYSDSRTGKTCQCEAEVSSQGAWCGNCDAGSHKLK